MLESRPAIPQGAPNPAILRPALTYPLALLMAEIGEACDGPTAAMGSRIAAALRVASATPNFLAPEFRAPRPGCYARHTVACDPAGRFTVLAIVWGPGQFSPPHAHDTWCAYAVVERTLTETLFEIGPALGRAVAVDVRQREPGYACFAPAGLDHIHRLGNAGDVPAISLHAYGVDGARIGTHVNRLVDVGERER